MSLSIVAKPRYATVRVDAYRKARARTSITVARHVDVLEDVSEKHGGVLPPYKWLNENGYFQSYQVMMDHPQEFKHIKTHEQFQAEKYAARPGKAQIMATDPKYKTLAAYHVKGATFSPTDLVLDNGLSEKEWMALGRKLSALHQSSKWWIGDFLLYGFRTYGKRATFDLGKQATGLTRCALYSCVRLSKRFPPERRVEALTCYHHQAVSKLAPETADKLLAEAVEIGLTARQLFTMADEIMGKKKSRFQRKKVFVILWQNTYDALVARANGRSINWYIADLIEEHITGQSVRRYVNGRKLKDFKAEIIAAGQGETEQVEAQ